MRFIIQETCFPSDYKLVVFNFSKSGKSLDARRMELSALNLSCDQSRVKILPLNAYLLSADSETRVSSISLAEVYLSQSLEVAIWINETVMRNQMRTSIHRMYACVYSHTKTDKRGYTLHALYFQSGYHKHIPHGELSRLTRFSINKIKLESPQFFPRVQFTLRLVNNSTSQLGPVRRASYALC